MPSILRAFAASVLLSFLTVAMANFLELPPGGYDLVPATQPETPAPEPDLCGCPGVAVTIAYMNLIDPDLVLEVEALLEAELEAVPDDASVALALLARLADGMVIEPGVYDLMVTSVTSCVLPRELAALFVFDVMTGVEFLRSALATFDVIEGEDEVDLGTVLAVIAVLGAEFDALVRDALGGLLLPSAQLLFVCDADVSRAIIATLDDPDVLTSIRDRYSDAISPMYDRTVTIPRDMR